MSQVGSAPAFRTGSPKKHELKSKQKLEKKLSFYTKVKDAVTSLNATKTICKVLIDPLVYYYSVL
jgi:hypothetical protein